MNSRPQSAPAPPQRITKSASHIDRATARLGRGIGSHTRKSKGKGRTLSEGLAKDAAAAVSETEEKARKKMSWRDKRNQKKADKKAGKMSAKAKRSSAPTRMSTASSVTAYAEAQPVPAEPEAPPTPPPEKKDLVMRVAKMKAKKEQEVVFKFPQVRMNPWGSKWAIDVFSLMHNAIKAELQDLYKMADVLQRRKMVLTLNHVSYFYQWWSDFEEFVTAALNIEEDIFYPWLASREPLRGDFKSSSRMKAYGKLRNTIISITAYRERFVPQLPVGERLGGLMELIAGCNHIPEYYDKVACSLPGFIELCFNKRDCSYVTRQMISTFRGQNGYDRNLAMLTRWMSDSNQRMWTLGHMSKRDMLKVGGWRRLMHREHFSLPGKLEELIAKEESAAESASGMGAFGASIFVANRSELKTASIRDAREPAAVGT